jgi:hypothetical protein
MLNQIAKHRKASIACFTSYVEAKKQQNKTKTNN